MERCNWVRKRQHFQVNLQSEHGAFHLNSIVDGTSVSGNRAFWTVYLQLMPVLYFPLTGLYCLPFHGLVVTATGMVDQVLAQACSMIFYLA